MYWYARKRRRKSGRAERGTLSGKLRATSRTSAIKQHGQERSGATPTRRDESKRAGQREPPPEVRSLSFLKGLMVVVMNGVWYLLVLAKDDNANTRVCVCVCETTRYEIPLQNGWRGRGTVWAVLLRIQ